MSERSGREIRVLSKKNYYCDEPATPGGNGGNAGRGGRGGDGKPPAAGGAIWFAGPERFLDAALDFAVLNAGGTGGRAGLAGVAGVPGAGGPGVYAVPGCGGFTGNGRPGESALNGENGNDCSTQTGTPGQILMIRLDGWLPLAID